MQIDCSDARYELKIGDRVRRSLIRHFHAFIIKQIKSRGFDADDPRLFNQDTIEAEAWRLAATAIEEAEREFRDALAARGHRYHDPLFTLLFLSADFLPAVRLTPRGVWDVRASRILLPARRRSR